MSTSDNETVRLALTQYLATENISGRELARRLGWTQLRVQARLAGNTQITVGDLGEIAKVLGVPVSKFIDDEPAVQS